MSGFASGAGEGVAGEGAVGAGAPGEATEAGAETTGAGPRASAPGPQATPAPAPGGPSGLGESESETERVAAQRDEYLEALRRLQAEFDNYRKRVTRQQTELLDRAAEGLLERLLPALDAIDLALRHGAGSPASGDGQAAFAQIASLLRDALAKDGLERIDAVGVRFDPAIHDAVAHLPATGPATGPAGDRDGDGAGAAPEEAASSANGAGGAAAGADDGAGGPPSAVVAEVHRAGYRLKGRVLRPAMVTVQG